MMNFDVSQLVGSIDSLSMVANRDSMPWPEELLDRGFKKKAGKFPGTKTWFYNGADEGQYEPSITLYQDYYRCWHCRVDLSVPKLVSGDNILLPTYEQIYEAIERVPNLVEHRIGTQYDAWSASTCRVDYAINIVCSRDLVGALIAYYARFDINYLLRQTRGNETVYFGNDSRAIRIYNKLAHIARKHKNRPDLIEKARGIVRAEYYVLKEPLVERFSKARGLSDSTVRTMVSPGTIKSVRAELLELLELDKVDLSAGDTFREIQEKTGGDVKKAIELFGFKAAVEANGEDFHLDPSYQYSKSTYARRLRECQSLGISL